MSQTKLETIGFIGLGRIGQPMAASLLAAGYGLRVFNRTAGKTAALVEKGATVANAAHETASRGGIVISVVIDDRAIRAVATDELARALGPGGIHLSMSTVLPTTSAQLAEEHARHGAMFVSAPFFGRPEAAAARKLWICASGPAAAKQRLKPVFDSLGQGLFDFGETPGSANVVKLAGNFLINSTIETLAEASVLAEKNGIPRKALLEMLTQTIFNCSVYNNYARRLIDADYEKSGFAMSGALKDMTLAHQTAVASKAPMPVLNLLCDRYLSAVAKGREGLDAAALALSVAEDAGIKW